MAGSASEGSLALCAVGDICLELDLLLQTTFTSEVKLHVQQFPLNNRGTFPLPELHVAAGVLPSNVTIYSPIPAFFCFELKIVSISCLPLAGAALFIRHLLACLVPWLLFLPEISHFLEFLFLDKITKASFSLAHFYPFSASPYHTLFLFLLPTRSGRALCTP